MKTLYVFMLLCPTLGWAQSETLKPIEKDLVPSYNGRYGPNVRNQYVYDGLDVRRTMDLQKYIMASGDARAIQEFNQYVASRHAGTAFVVTGIAAMITGTAVMASNRAYKDGTFYTKQVVPCPPGYYCGTPSSLPSPGVTTTVYDSKRAKGNAIGGITLLAGGILTGIGWGMRLPGPHVRRAVQYYNRSLRNGLSLRVEPYATYSSSGLGLVGRF